MQKIITPFITLIARILPGNILWENRLYLAKYLLLGLVVGYLISFPLNHYAKKAIKVLKKWLKEKNRNKRIAAYDVPDATYIGEVTQYLSNLNVAVIKVKKEQIGIGDPIMIRGKKTKVGFRVKSMQINRKSVELVKKGHEAGFLVPGTCKTGDLVYKVKR